MKLFNSTLNAPTKPMKRSQLKPKKWWNPIRKPWKKKKSRHNMKKMGTGVHINAKGRCEWCGRPLPLGTPAAHLIPRDINDLTLDEPWNGALLCIAGNQCHTRFDANRARALEELEAEGKMKIPNRIAANDRLTAYFDIRKAKNKYRRDMAKGWLK